MSGFGKRGLPMQSILIRSRTCMPEWLLLWRHLIIFGLSWDVELARLRHSQDDNSRCMCVCQQYNVNMTLEQG